MARGRIIPNALQKGRDHLKDEDRALQGKNKTKVLMNEIKIHHERMEKIKHSYGNDNIFFAKRKRIHTDLTDSSHQFKKERIDKKIQKVKQKYSDRPNPNVYQQRTGQTLTPLILGKIRYHKTKKKHNINAVRGELVARGLTNFDNKTNWLMLLKILKQHEQDEKFFKPQTDYNNFKWLSTHFDALGNVRE